MSFVLSKILDILLSPYSWGIALLVFGLSFRKAKVVSERLRKASFLGLAITLFFSLEPVANRLTLMTEAPSRPMDVTGKKYDAVVLLGGIIDDRVMSRTGQRSMNNNVERLLTTFELLKSGVAAHAIVSGSSPTAGKDTVEADVLKTQLVEWGIEPGRIIVEGRSLNTRENALFTMEIAHQRGFQNLLLVTSAFHMRRSLGCFLAVGARPDPYPVDFRAYDPSVYPSSWLPRAEYMSRSNDMLHELWGRTVYRLRGYARFE